MNNCQNCELPTTFTGLPANLKVEKECDYNKIQEVKIEIWRFYNQDKNPSSLINRVEICKDCFGISFVNIFLHRKGCELFRDIIPTLNADVFHHHEFNSCKIQLTHSKDIRTILNLLYNLQKDPDNLKSESGLALAKL